MTKLVTSAVSNSWGCRQPTATGRRKSFRRTFPTIRGELLRLNSQGKCESNLLRIAPSYFLVEFAQRAMLLCIKDGEGEREF